MAIGVGSRGISRLRDIVTALVGELSSWGLRPFIFPAMGSHGGATASGQLEMLTHLGVTESRVGAPIESQMDTAVVGRTPDGMPVHLDRRALAADAIVFVARIKPHTAFRGPYESGLAKMIAIGIGKQAGAAATHARGFGDMADMVPAMARVAIERAPIRFGLGVIENARDEVCRVVLVPADRVLDEEPPLLDQAREAMARLPFEFIDVLVIDRIGKDISGDGADPNITGRYPTPYASGGPTVNKMVVLDLTEASGGNGTGIGIADFTTQRFARKLDLGRTYPNALTSTVPGPVKLPMTLPGDRLALAAAVLTCNAVGRQPRLVRIADTLHLGSLWISEVMLGEAGEHPHLRLIEAPRSLDFDAAGNLRDLAGDMAVSGAPGRQVVGPW